MSAKIAWHLMHASEAVKMLKSHLTQGLNDATVTQKRQQEGTNTLTQKKGESLLILFLKEFHTPLIYILLIAAVIVGFLQEWVEMGVILGVVFINAIIGFVQESKALRSIQALAKVLNYQAVVIRNQQRQTIPATDLVSGDIVLLQSGDRVPADLRLFEVKELQVDESALTGESLPVEKKVATLESEVVLGDRSNMAYSSTLITQGIAKGIVVATGDRTEIGKINQMISSADILVTPLTKKINDFSRFILWVILALTGIVMTASLLSGKSLNDALLEGVALAVGAIPEGLPAALTITLAIGVSRMAQRRAIIRKLPAVETLGSTTIICSDKTGTLTQNEMTVQKLFIGDTLINVSGIGYQPTGAFHKGEEEIDPLAQATIKELLKAGLLCNDAQLIQKEEVWRVEGDPTEGCLLTVGMKAGFDLPTTHQQFPRVEEIPFESAYQYMATLHTTPTQEQTYIYMKGAVEKILARCNQQIDFTGTLHPLDATAIEAKVDQLAAQGLRVLAFARKEVAAQQNTLTHQDVATGLTFLGLQAMIDPPRPEAIEAIEACKTAGIQVKMITGDHVKTAIAIAKKLGLASNTTDTEGITGKAMSELRDEELAKVAPQKEVFARVSPAQKLQLIKIFQAQDHIVAMTGDGVNDAPALRQANIGIAMGITGTEVVKETSDMILTDDNFASIELAVEEGRRVLDNLIKFITWALPTNIAEGLVILIASFLGLVLPITPLQILWINMTTTIFLGSPLAFEPKEPDIMQRQPRNPNAPLLTRELVWRMLWVGLFLVIGVYIVYEYAIQQGSSVAQARTLAVNIIVFGELFYLYNMRSLLYSQFTIGFFTNPWLVAGTLVMTGIQLLFTYSPFMNKLFDTAPITLQGWVVVLAISSVLYGLVELEKNIRRWRLQRKK
ncbi:MAG: cation-transporting P-type ATPase [Thermonemataceae bacterium]